MEGKTPLGSNVVIIGGGTVGSEVALYAAKQGAMSPEVACFLLKHKVINADEAVECTSHGNRNITLLEMKRKVGGGFGVSTRWIMLNELKDAGILAETGVKVKRIVDDHEGSGIVYEKDGQEHFIKADTIIVAAGYRPNAELQDEISRKFSESYSIGDCVKVRTALEAIHEGFQVALKI